MVVKWISGQYMKRKIPIYGQVIWCKPDCNEIFSIVLPSIVVKLFLHLIYLNSHWNRRGLLLKKDYFALFWFSSSFSLKGSYRSCNWLENLYNAMKLKCLKPDISLHLTLSSLYRWFLKARNSFSAFKHLHVFLFDG